MDLPDEMARKILADEVLIDNPASVELARMIRAGTAEQTNQAVRVALAAMRLACWCVAVLSPNPQTDEENAQDRR